MLLAHIVERLPAQLKTDGALVEDVMPSPWSELLARPGTGEADFIISSITARASRENDFAIQFSHPYYRTTLSLPWSAQATGRHDEPVAVLVSGARVGVQADTTSDAFIARLMAARPGSCEVIRYKQSVDAAEALHHRDVQFVVTDTPFAELLAMEWTGLHTRELDGRDYWEGSTQEEREEPYAVAVRYGDAELLTAINAIIDEAVNDGTIERFVPTAREDHARRSKPQTVEFSQN